MSENKNESYIKGKFVVFAELIIVLAVLNEGVSLFNHLLNGAIANVIGGLILFIPFLYFVKNYYFVKKGNETHLSPSTKKWTKYSGYLILCLLTLSLIFGFLVEIDTVAIAQAAIVLVSLSYLFSKVKLKL